MRADVGDVVASDEDLSDGLLEGAEELIPEGDESSLANGGEGLLLAEGALLGGGEGGEVEAVEAHADGAGGNDHDAVAEGTEGDAGFDEGGEGGDLGKVGRVGLENGGGAWEAGVSD